MYIIYRCENRYIVNSNLKVYHFDWVLQRYKKFVIHYLLLIYFLVSLIRYDVPVMLTRYDLWLYNYSALLSYRIYNVKTLVYVVPFSIIMVVYFSITIYRYIVFLFLLFNEFVNFTTQNYKINVIKQKKLWKDIIKNKESHHTTT